MALLLELLRDWLNPQGLIAIGVIYTGIQQWRAARAQARAHMEQAKVLATVVEKVDEVHAAAINGGKK